jgi:hypothetical protein
MHPQPLGPEKRGSCRGCVGRGFRFHWGIFTRGLRVSSRSRAFRTSWQVRQRLCLLTEMRGRLKMLGQQRHRCRSHAINPLSSAFHPQSPQVGSGLRWRSGCIGGLCRSRGGAGANVTEVVSRNEETRRIPRAKSSMRSGLLVGSSGGKGGREAGSVVKSSEEGSAVGRAQSGAGPAVTRVQGVGKGQLKGGRVESSSRSATEAMSSAS